MQLSITNGCLLWWPSIDDGSDLIVKACTNCTEIASDPSNLALHQWDISGKPWQHLYVDFIGPHRGKMWMLVVDAYSK